MKTIFLKNILKLTVEGFELKQKTLYLQSTEKKKSIYLLVVLLEDHNRNVPVSGQEQCRFHYFKVIQRHNHSFVHQNGNTINSAHEKVSLLHRVDLRTVLTLGSSSWWALGLQDKAIPAPSLWLPVLGNQHWQGCQGADCGGWNASRKKESLKNKCARALEITMACHFKCGNR